MPEPHADSDAILRRVADLIEQTKNLDYSPSESDGVWVCGDHGVDECTQGDCADLTWPEPNSNDILGAFTDWAHTEFLRAVRDYDEGREPEMPEDSFRSYSVWEWPVGDLIEQVYRPGAEADR